MNRRFQREIELLHEDNEDIVLWRRYEGDPLDDEYFLPRTLPKVRNGYAPIREYVDGHLILESVYVPKKNLIRARKWYVDIPDQLAYEVWYTTDGKRTKRARYWDYRGHLWYVAHYRNDRRHGRTWRRNLRGVLVFSARYYHGCPIGPFYKRDSYGPFCNEFHGWVIGGRLVGVSGCLPRYDSEDEYEDRLYPCQGVALGWSVSLHEHIHVMHREAIRSLFLSCRLKFHLANTVASFIPCAVMGPLAMECF